jgi:tRNA dimethylallyltransferase
MPGKYDSNMFRLIAVVGPTASGKSELGLHLAHRLNGEIINCDSLQIFRHFDIGSAKLPLAARQGIPHHLIDIAQPDEIFTAGDYARMAREVVHEVASRGRLPIVVGGTGFYLRALLDGLPQVPGRDADLRARLMERETRRTGFLHRMLRGVDLTSAQRIHPHDIQKLLRALEVSYLSKNPMSKSIERVPLAGFQVLKLGLNPPRDQVYQEINQRCHSMFDAGLVEETRHILSLGFPPDTKPLQALGYRQALDYIEDKSDRATAIKNMQLHTRHYAKRQWTWFRREAQLIWLDGFGQDTLVQQKAVVAAQ